MSLVAVIVTSVAAFLGALLALKQIADGMRKRWLEDEDHSRRLEENTVATRELTASMTAVTRTLEEHERRLKAGNL